MGVGLEVTMTQFDLVAQEVLDYWRGRTACEIRSQKVRERTLARIEARLGEGFGPEDLKKCVEFAMFDEFYAEKGYFRQPDVIWRNAERVQSILSRWKHAAAKPLPL